MRKTLFYTFLIFFYHILVIFLPILLFMVSLSLANRFLLQILPWLYSLFMLLSPLIIIYLGYLAVRDKKSTFGWLIPIFISFIGNLPFLILYCLFSSLTTALDYLLLIGLPILWGLLADLTLYNSGIRSRVALIKLP
jgi:hypothetical protein